MLPPSLISAFVSTTHLPHRLPFTLHHSFITRVARRTALWSNKRSHSTGDEDHTTQTVAQCTFGSFASVYVGIRTSVSIVCAGQVHEAPWLDGPSLRSAGPRSLTHGRARGGEGGWPSPLFRVGYSRAKCPVGVRRACFSITKPTQHAAPSPLPPV